MNSKLIIAILVIAAMPLGFFTLRTHQVTKADAQEVLKIISGDKAKTQSYCDMTGSMSRSSRPKRKRTAKQSMSCPRNWIYWKKNWVPNMPH
jgi:hypothetical protein